MFHPPEAARYKNRKKCSIGVWHDTKMQNLESRGGESYCRTFINWPWPSHSLTLDFYLSSVK